MSKLDELEEAAFKAVDYSIPSSMCRDAVKAILIALRDASPLMIEAHKGGLVREFGLTVTDGYIHRIHRRVIDAVLNE